MTLTKKAPTTPAPDTKKGDNKEAKSGSTVKKTGARYLPIKVARKDIDLTGDDKYGHWWTELEGTESYGWWPKYPVGAWGTLAGVDGELNGQTSFGGTATLDPHHHDRSAGVNLFRVKTKDPTKTDATILSEVRTFANSYSGEWRWTFGGGQNCHTFQEALLKNSNLDTEKI
jgi:hypothetical protein